LSVARNGNPHQSCGASSAIWAKTAKDIWKWRANHGERGAQAYNGGLGAEPPAGSRGRASGQGVRARSPAEAETILAFGRSTKAANLPIFLNSQNTEKPDICVVLPMWPSYHPILLIYIILPYTVCGMELCPPEANSFFWTLCCSLWHARCVCCPSFVCGSRLYCGQTMQDRAKVDIDH